MNLDTCLGWHGSDDETHASTQSNQYTCHGLENHGYTI